MSTNFAADNEPRRIVQSKIARRGASLNWIREHIVASLLIVGGLGATVQYAASKFITRADRDAAAVAKSSKAGVRAMAKAGLGSVNVDYPAMDAALLDAAAALDEGVDPELEPILRDAYEVLRRHRSHRNAPDSAEALTDAAKVGPAVNAVIAADPKLRRKYGSSY